MTDYGTFRPTNYRYLTSEMLDAGTGAAILGGFTTRLKAAGTLYYGDVVQVTTTAGRVNTATTNLNLTVGVVVGGLETDSEVLTDSAGVGTTVCAAAAGDEVIVQRSGVVWVALDTDDVTIGDPIIPSAITAGRVGKGTNGYTVAAGASTVFSSGSSGAIISGNGPAVPIIGHTQTTETVAGNPILLLMRGLI